MASHGSDRPRLPVGAVYDLAALRGFVPVLSEEVFRARAPARAPLSAELLVRDFAYTGQLAHLGLWCTPSSAVAARSHSVAAAAAAAARRRTQCSAGG